MDKSDLKDSTKAPEDDAPKTPTQDEPAAAETAENAPPDWLTAEFLQKALEADPEGDGSGLRVTGFHAEPAVGKGDNYASLMLRVRVDLLESAGDGDQCERRSQRNLIVKSMPQSGMSRAWVERSLLFPKERRMYLETLPRMEGLLRDRLGARPFGQFTPHAIYCSDEILVFEDLRDLDFKMAARQRGMDLKHCLMVMRALGTYHALSIAMHEENPASVEYKESFYTEEALPDFEAFIPNAYETLAKIVESWPGYERYGDKLRGFGKRCVRDIMKLIAETDDRFKVLNHGDCWVNNMLFKYDDKTGEPTELRLLDFQICRFASMVFDLQYFLFSSPRPDIRIEKMDEMLSEYHSALGQVLQELGLAHRQVTLEDLHLEMKRTLLFGLTSASNLLPIVVAEPSEAMEFEGVTEEELLSGEVDILGKTYRGKTFANAYRLLLPYFEERGVL